MAKTSSKKSASGKKGSSSPQSKRNNSSILSSASLEKNLKNYRNTVLDWSEQPAAKYIIGGVGFAVLARLAYQFSESYPGAVQFLRNQLDTVEDKLREYRGGSFERTGMDARH